MSMTQPLSLFLLLLFSLSASAALPLKAIKRFQEKAPEHLNLRVTAVKEKIVKKGKAHYYSLSVEAKITKVLKSSSQLKEGDVITLNYDVPNTKKTPQAGDWAPRLRAGNYEAFLKKDAKGDKQFVPAAYSGSFLRDKVQKSK